MDFGRARIIAVLAAALAAPATVHAQAPTGGTPAPGANPSGVVSVTDGSFSLAARADALLYRTARFRGTLPSSQAGRTVTIEREDVLTAEWVPVATATIAGDGSFIARWRTDHIGRFTIRARVDSDGAQASSASPNLAVTVYKDAVATWYGPGFYGHKTACGIKLTRATLGVAHRRVPCGTQVAIIYDGLTLTVPVIDRGPFAHGADWDLTSATAQALGMTATSHIGAVRLRS